MNTRFVLLTLVFLVGCKEDMPTPSPVDLEPLPVEIVSVQPDLTVPPLESTPICYEDRIRQERMTQTRILRRNHIAFSDSTEGLNLRFIRGNLDTMEFYDHVEYIQSVQREGLEQWRCDGLPLELWVEIHKS